MSISFFPHQVFADKLVRQNSIEKLKVHVENSELRHVNHHPKWLPRHSANDSVSSLLQQLDQVALGSEDKFVENVQVSGRSYGDVPATYNVPPLRKHERPVIGTFVHPDICPGFRYYVRRNGSANYLFGGKSMCLESIGQGYGKRLTFESDDILENDNFFWSDSNADEGFAFAVDVLSVADTFDVFTEMDYCGVAEILAVCEGQEILSSSSTSQEHFKEVQVNFRCKIQHEGKTVVSDAAGIVTLCKSKHQRHAELLRINALFLPSGKMYVLVPPDQEN